MQLSLITIYIWHCNSLLSKAHNEKVKLKRQIVFITRMGYTFAYFCSLLFFSDYFILLAVLVGIWGGGGVWGVCTPPPNTHIHKDAMTFIESKNKWNTSPPPLHPWWNIWLPYHKGLLFSPPPPQYITKKFPTPPPPRHPEYNRPIPTW